MIHCIAMELILLLAKCEVRSSGPSREIDVSVIHRNLVSGLGVVRPSAKISLGI